ncbi:hypothetical protein [Ruminococcus flavefaciens]|uniref:Uncharacterized protein n=1 Tax=Ruminococcus flavefaciens TaxID=1265 RepID=A0A1M7J5Z7_RUMFL|nr:hypothetical protein [Ruminococcus flavefaciens]SHM48560.1 hypothetical protein SAMN04487860_105160 [Ruminococcus flavefaciens]
MKRLFANVWTKRVVAILSVIYTYFVCKLCYYSIFYDIHVHQRTSLCLSITGVSLAALIIMLYTRHQILTRISSFIILPAMLPVVLLYFGEWGLIIPIIVVGIVILLLSGAGEGVKTALATVILLMYIFGALGYFLFTSFFVSPAKETEVGRGVSPSGDYRYRIVNSVDTSNGSTAIYVEPNTADVKYSFVTFTLKNMERVVFLDRPSDDEVQVNWSTENRQEITDHLNAISDKIEVTVTDAELEKLGYTYDNKLQLINLSASRKFALGLTASDVAPVYIDTLNDEQLDFFGIGKEADGRYYVKNPSADLIDEVDGEHGKRIYFSEMDTDALRLFNSEQVDAATGISYFNVKKCHTVMLNSLTDKQLEDLGVSQSGDVMSITVYRDVKKDEDEEQTETAENTEAAEPERITVAENKVVFRFYVAELEDFYDVNSRRISVDLFN